MRVHIARKSLGRQGKAVVPRVSIETNVRIEGLRETRNALKRVDNELPKALRKRLKERVAEPVAAAMKRNVPKRSGKWASQIRAGSTQTGAYVQWNRNLAYPGWVEFGGTIRQPRRGVSISRPIRRKGRYVAPVVAQFRNRTETEAKNVVEELAREAGL